MSDRSGSRPGGRSARVRSAVLDAADRLVALDTHAITVRALSVLSGVSEPTIYRRWRSADGVVLDAAQRYLSEALPLRATGNLDRDVRRWAESVQRGFGSPLGRIFVPTLARVGPGGRGQVGARAFAAERLKQIDDLLLADGAPGWLTPDRLFDKVVAPLYARQLFGMPTTLKLARGLAAEALTPPS